jgi:hypothetical protein
MPTIDLCDIKITVKLNEPGDPTSKFQLGGLPAWLDPDPAFIGSPQPAS